MSLYDDATFIYSGEAAAGAPHRAYTLKPAEKLKPTILNANSDLSTSGALTSSIGDRGFVLSDSTANSSASIANGLLTITNGASVNGENRARVYTSNGTTTAYLENGKSYNLTYTVVENNGVTDFKYAEDGIIRPAPTEIGTHAVSFKRGEHNDSPYFYLQSETPNANIVLKDIIVREAEQRSLDFRVTRGSNLAATRVKADGLIEKGRENLLLQSNQFDTTWSQANTSVTGGRGGYDGSSNAWELKMTSTQGGANEARTKQDGLSVSGVSTYSVYAKAGNVNWVRILGLSSGTNPFTYFDLSGDGAIGSTSSSVAHSSITKIGTSGWFRISLTHKGAGHNITDVRINIADADGSLFVAQNSYIFIQDAQLEAGLVATAPIESKSMTGKAGLLANEPRYDYLTSTTDCPGALMEPGRTNLVKNSEYLGDYSASNATITTNALTSPEGLDNATTINVTSNSGSVYAQSGGQVASVTAETQYVFSFYVKQGTNTENYLAVRDQNAESFISEDVAYTASSSEWKRIEHTFTTPAGCTSVRLYPQRYDSGGQGTTHLWGIQLEEGPWATSYIPTYGSTATRTKDVFVSPVDDSEYATDDFTFFIDYKDFKNVGASAAGLWRALYRDSTRSIFQYSTSIGYHGFPSSTPSTPGSEYSSGHATEGANKIAVVYNRDSIAVYVDGTQTKLDYSVDTTQKGLQYIDLNYGNSKMTLNSIMVFNRPLTKDEAIALTT